VQRVLPSAGLQPRNEGRIKHLHEPPHERRPHGRVHLPLVREEQSRLVREGVAARVEGTRKRPQDAPSSSSSGNVVSGEAP